MQRPLRVHSQEDVRRAVMPQATNQVTQETSYSIMPGTQPKLFARCVIAELYTVQASAAATRAATVEDNLWQANSSLVHLLASVHKW
jgi:hypothetical protein